MYEMMWIMIFGSQCLFLAMLPVFYVIAVVAYQICNRQRISV